MSLPAPVRSGVERALLERGLGNTVLAVVPVGGGCINNGARLETDAGVALFLKWNPTAPERMFEAEADGLKALAAARAVRVPAPLAWAKSGGTRSWLLMEYIPVGQATNDTDVGLGRGLAAIHLHEPDADAFGWPRDNWIGSLPQSNTQSGSWGTFWRDERIAPQLSMARDHGHLSDAVLDRVLDLIPTALRDIDRPELLHGDLWGGNWFSDEHGAPVMIDPATYRGDGEVDVAMSELFGGFGPRFFEAYREAHGLSSAYAAYRKDLYQLYYLLVHVNLFGASYTQRALAAAQRVAAELRG